MTNIELTDYLLDKIDVIIENNIKLNKGDKHVKQQKGSNKKKKVFSNELS